MKVERDGVNFVLLASLLKCLPTLTMIVHSGITFIPLSSDGNVHYSESASVCTCPCMHVQACLLCVESVPLYLCVFVIILETFIKRHVSGLKGAKMFIFAYLKARLIVLLFTVWVEGLMNQCCLVKHWLSGANELVKQSTSEVGVVTQCLCPYGWSF